MWMGYAHTGQIFAFFCRPCGLSYMHLDLPSLWRSSRKPTRHRKGVPGGTCSRPFYYKWPPVHHYHIIWINMHIFWIHKCQCIHIRQEAAPVPFGLALLLSDCIRLASVLDRIARNREGILRKLWGDCRCCLARKVFRWSDSNRRGRGPCFPRKFMLEDIWKEWSRRWERD